MRNLGIASRVREYSQALRPRAMKRLAGGGARRASALGDELGDDHASLAAVCRICCRSPRSHREYGAQLPQERGAARPDR